MKSIARAFVGGTVLSLFGLAGPAHADLFSYGLVSASIGNGPATTKQFGPYENVASAPDPQTASVTLGDGAMGTATITESPVLVSASASTVDNDNVYVTTHLDYSVTVSGPSGPVDLGFTAALHASGSSDAAYAFGSFYAASATRKIGFAPGDPSFAVCVQNYTGCNSGADQIISSSTMLNANEAYTVDEFTSATAQDFDAMAKATADPIFILTEGELDAGYSLVITPGVANGTVPEPGAWALMLTGLGVTGGALRRVRSRTLAG